MDIIFSSWADDQGVRAILLPFSDAAHHSAKLPQNKAHIEPIRKKLPLSRLPSPPECKDDSETSHEEDIKVLAEKAIRSADRALVLRQKKNLNRFTFGSDICSFFVLEDHPTSKDSVCHINWSHCQLYPHPDCSDLWIKNSSTSKQTIQDWPLLSKTHHISFGQSVPLQSGTWILRLGEGLRFILHIASLVEVYNPSINILSTPSGIKKGSKAPSIQKKSNTEPRTKLLKSNAKVIEQNRSGPLSNDGSESAKQNVTKPQDAPDTKSRLQAPKKIIGQTYCSRVEEGEWVGKRVAIKYCRRPEVPVASTMWWDEVQALRTLSKHHNVVEILDADGSKYTITMELVPGASLEKYADDKFNSTLTEEQCRDIWLGAAQGLRWVHEKGLLYNDLKAENTMYDLKSRRTVLIDFGVAAHNIGQYFSAGGTPCYIAPEYPLRQRDPVSDIWALGILMMFALKLIELPQDTWKLDRVFDMVSPESVKMKAWIARVLAKVDEAPPHHLEILRRMMCIRPKGRMHAAELVACLKSQQRQTLELLA